MGGNVAEARRRLEWIAGPGGERLIEISDDGKVELNWTALMQRAGVDGSLRGALCG